MRSIYSLSTLGTMALILYILFDFLRNKSKNLLPRIVFYSFVFYMCVVLQLITGGISIPPSDRLLGARFQVIPFEFVADLVGKLDDYGLGYRFLTALKLYFFNFIMLMPFGVYLAIYFRVKAFKKSVLIILALTLGIEILQAILSESRLLMSSRTTSIDDVILNTAGATIAYVLSKKIPIRALERQA